MFLKSSPTVLILVSLSTGVSGPSLRVKRTAIQRAGGAVRDAIFVKVRRVEHTAVRRAAALNLVLGEKSVVAADLQVERPAYIASVSPGLVVEVVDRAG